MRKLCTLTTILIFTTLTLSTEEHRATRTCTFAFATASPTGKSAPRRRAVSLPCKSCKTNSVWPASAATAPNTRSARLSKRHPGKSSKTADSIRRLSSTPVHPRTWNKPAATRWRAAPSRVPPIQPPIAALVTPAPRPAAGLFSGLLHLLPQPSRLPHALTPSRHTGIGFLPPIAAAIILAQAPITLAEFMHGGLCRSHHPRPSPGRSKPLI